MISSNIHERQSALTGFAALAAYSLQPEAEGLGCSMRIPVTAESEGIEALLGVPKPYTKACYIGIGYPTEETRKLPQERLYIVGQAAHGEVVNDPQVKAKS